uniref:serine/threonine-protein kinase SIK1 isoform X2 n=1 Tax=Pristiophorus japonicus TaxID=55135 RepID=UPI00398EC099
METKDMLYIVTEFAQNGEMFDYLSANGPLSESQARTKFWQILTAVEYCHNHHIVHRDLKSENLLLDVNMNIKIADFGFGNFYKHGEPLCTWCGSPPYAAPEVFEGKAYEGPHIDIWSLGVVLYVLVCGSLPFDGPTLPVLRQRVIEGRFRIPFFLSEDCENLIRRMLMVDPTKRITVSQIKQHRWMLAQTSLQQPLDYSLKDYNSNLGNYNQQVLGLMHNLGIDRQKTVESLQNSSYNHFAAIYYLLLERVKEHRSNPAVNCLTSAQYHMPRTAIEHVQTEVCRETLAVELMNPRVQVGPLSTPMLHSDLECDLACFQPILPLVDASVNVLIRNRSMSPNNLLETAIHEEVRQEQGLEEDVMGKLPSSSHVVSSTSRRHTVAEVSAHFSRTAPCVCAAPQPSIPEGASSDSCLMSSSNGGFHATNSSGLPDPAMPPPLVYTTSATPILQAQGAGSSGTPLPGTFQEGRRASDTSLTPGLKPFRQQLRKSTRAKGFFGLNKITGFTRQVWLSPSCMGPRNRLSLQQPPSSPQQIVSVAPSLALGCSTGDRKLLDQVLHQQRMLQLRYRSSPQPTGTLAFQSVLQSAPYGFKTAPHPTPPLLLSDFPHEDSEMVYTAQSQLSCLVGVSLPHPPSTRTLDLHPTFSEFLQQAPFTLPEQSEGLGVDCEMEDLSAVQLGNIVLVN